MVTTIAQSVGTAIEPGMTALEAVMKHKRMDWNTQFAPVFYRTPLTDLQIGGVEEEYTAIESKKAVLRDDNKDCLGIVGQSFQAIPNRTAFSVADSIEGGEIVGCGEYGGGKTSWLQLKLNRGSLPILGDDVIDQYILVVTGHVGNSKLMIILTPIRVVCKNTLMAAISGRKAKTSGYIRHSGDVDDKVKLSKDLLLKAGVFFKDTQERFITFARANVTQPVVEDYFKRVEKVELKHYVVDEETRRVTDELMGRKRNMLDRYKVAYHGDKLGADLPGVRGTVWGAYNAVTQVQDHDIVEEKRNDSGGKSANDRAAHQLFEGGPIVKQRAFDLAVELVGSLN